MTATCPCIRKILKRFARCLWRRSGPFISQSELKLNMTLPVHPFILFKSSLTHYSSIISSSTIFSLTVFLRLRNALPSWHLPYRSWYLEAKQSYLSTSYFLIYPAAQCLLLPSDFPWIVLSIRFFSIFVLEFRKSLSIEFILWQNIVYPILKELYKSPRQN